jgi:hypothetical protein
MARVSAIRPSKRARGGSANGAIGRQWTELSGFAQAANPVEYLNILTAAGFRCYQGNVPSLLSALTRLRHPVHRGEKELRLLTLLIVAGAPE